MTTVPSSLFMQHQSAALMQGGIEDWVLEGHKLAQRVAYGDLASADPVPITSDHEREAGPVVELQLERAGVRLAYLLNQELR